MNRSFAIVKELVALRADRLQIRENVEYATWQVELVERELIPAEGWPGKNETERKIAATDTVENNLQVLVSRQVLREQKKDLATVEMLIDNLHSEQAAIEWTVRDEANRVLGGKSVFDALMDAELDGQKEAADDDGDNSDGEVWGDEVPFDEAVATDPTVTDDGDVIGDTLANFASQWKTEAGRDTLENQLHVPVEPHEVAEEFRGLTNAHETDEVPF